MRISFIKSKYCLGVKELEFRPGKITIIEGEEGKGKTSILEAIQRLFYNKSERPQFVHSDGDRAEMYLVLDDGTDIRKYWNKENKPTTVKVERNGMQPSAAEAYLKGLVSDKQLNPISLIEMDDKQLSELILSLIPIRVTTDDLKDWVSEVPQGIDLDNHGLQVCKDVEKHYYDTRTNLNRKIKDLSAEVDLLKEKIPEGYNPDDWRNVSLTEKYEAIRDANKVNSDRKIHQTKVDNKDSIIESLRNKAKADIADIKQESAESKKAIEDEIAKLKQQIIALEGELSQADAVCDEKVRTITEHYKKLAEATEKEAEESKKYLEQHKLIDIEPLEKAHREAEDMKSYVRIADELKDKEKDLESKERESKTLTYKIEFMRTKPQMLLANAEMPIDGLTIDGQGNILINERPIKNLSGGERIRFVMNIVRATAGQLKIILIDGFEKLSPRGQREFIEECTGDGFQYIITKVADGSLKITAIDESGSAVDAETGELK